MKIKAVLFNGQSGGFVYSVDYCKKVACSIAGSALMVSAMGVQAEDSLPPIQLRSNAPQSLERRLDALEKRVSRQTLMEILDQLEAVKREIQELRGSVEEITHGLEGVKKRQRSLYLDIDERLQKLEGSGNESQALETPSYDEPSKNISTDSEVPPSPVKKASSQEASTLVASSQKSSTQEASAEETSSYRKAYQTLQNRRYNSAIQQLKTFLETYPNGQLAGNAQYWLGEAFYSRRDFPQAKEAFTNILERHPSSSKVADALLKLGFVEYELGNWKNSNQRLSELISTHPNSTAAKLAEKRLHRQRTEKR